MSILRFRRGRYCRLMVYNESLVLYLYMVLRIWYFKNWENNMLTIANTAKEGHDTDFLGYLQTSIQYVVIVLFNNSRICKCCMNPGLVPLGPICCLDHKHTHACKQSNCLQILKWSCPTFSEEFNLVPWWPLRAFDCVVYHKPQMFSNKHGYHNSPYRCVGL